ncbi:COQ9 family protein [Sphingomicrobium lutaoense]|uniref:Ubiquinone biosynthesis protein COQ9 n=1 Tax=Sphingomicrobium lutaoense TaxID=515949 RepID=A0A839YXC5_9SPHN|nr:COQ9 family protein [Sphingomicrobium lutaoense]MBB3764841.1 ubiquinone biosynthesis protein COQ9 [Sphingomicrobium lutaoense]
MTSPLENLRRKLSLVVAENAVFDGWTDKAVIAAADQLGIDRDQARLAFPDRPADMVAAWIEGVDAAMVEAFPPEKIAAMKVRDRIRNLIWFRLETAAPAREAMRSALSILAMPQNVPLGLRTGWNSADLMWRLAGDTSTDYNHYSKRLILSGVYGSTLLAWLDDDSDGWQETAAFLDRRLADVMRFEKLKSSWKSGSAHRPSITRFLGRLRYPAR